MEDILEVIVDGAVSTRGKTGCFFISILLLVILFVIGYFIWFNSNSKSVNAVVIEKLSDNRLRYRLIDNDKIITNEVSSKLYDDVDKNDTIIVNVVL